jgi:predicted transcriptional regulator
VDHYLLHNAGRCFPVMQNDKFVGLITPDEIRKVDRSEWDQTSVQSVMRPANQLRAVPPQMPALDALELMAGNNLNELVVVADGRLQGVFSRGQVARFLQVHSGAGSEPRDLAA